MFSIYEKCYCSPDNVDINHKKKDFLQKHLHLPFGEVQLTPSDTEEKNLNKHTRPLWKRKLEKAFVSKIDTWKDTIEKKPQSGKVCCHLGLSVQELLLQSGRSNLVMSLSSNSCSLPPLSGSAACQLTIQLYPNTSAQWNALLSGEFFSHYLAVQHNHNYKEYRSAHFIPLSFSSCFGSTRCLSSQLIMSEVKHHAKTKDINWVMKRNLIYWHRSVGKDLWQRAQYLCHLNQQQQSIQPAQARSATEKHSFSSRELGITDSRRQLDKIPEGSWCSKSARASEGKWSAEHHTYQGGGVHWEYENQRQPWLQRLWDGGVQDP